MIEIGNRRGQDKYINIYSNQNFDFTKADEIENFKRNTQNFFINLTPDEEFVLISNSENSFDIQINYLKTDLTYTTSVTERTLFTQSEINFNQLSVKKSFLYFTIYDTNNDFNNTLIGYVLLKGDKSLFPTTTSTNITINEDDFEIYLRKTAFVLPQTQYFLKLELYNSKTGKKIVFNTSPDINSTPYYPISINKVGYSLPITQFTTVLPSPILFYENKRTIINEQSLNPTKSPQYADPNKDNIVTIFNNTKIITTPSEENVKGVISGTTNINLNFVEISSFYSTMSIGNRFETYAILTNYPTLSTVNIPYLYNGLSRQTNINTQVQYPTEIPLTRNTYRFVFPDDLPNQFVSNDFILRIFGENLTNPQPNYVTREVDLKPIEGFSFTPYYELSHCFNLNKIDFLQNRNIFQFAIENTTTPVLTTTTINLNIYITQPETITIKSFTDFGDSISPTSFSLVANTNNTITLQIASRKFTYFIIEFDNNRHEFVRDISFTNNIDCSVYGMLDLSIFNNLKTIDCTDNDKVVNVLFGEVVLENFIMRRCDSFRTFSSRNNNALNFSNILIDFAAEGITQSFAETLAELVSFNRLNATPQLSPYTSTLRFDDNVNVTVTLMNNIEITTYINIVAIPA